MSKLTEQDRKLKQEIGSFVIAFSQMEFGLAELCNLCEQDMRKFNDRYAASVSLTIERKRKKISKFILRDLPELNHEWKRLNKEIGEINDYRRLIIHGIITYYLPNEDLKGIVHNNGVLNFKDIKWREIRDATQRIHFINSGPSGVLGEFHSKFKKLRVDNWNKLVQDEFKIIYKLNNEIVSEWKGN